MLGRAFRRTNQPSTSPPEPPSTSPPEPEPAAEDRAPEAEPTPADTAPQPIAGTTVPTTTPKPRRFRRKGRIRRLLRHRTVRVILALIAVFCCWVAF